MPRDTYVYGTLIKKLKLTDILSQPVQTFRDLCCLYIKRKYVMWENNAIMHNTNALSLLYIRKYLSGDKIRIIGLNWHIKLYALLGLCQLCGCSLT